MGESTLALARRNSAWLNEHRCSRYSSDEGHADPEKEITVVAVEKYGYIRRKRRLFCAF